jgi:hypothetical protein
MSMPQYSSIVSRTLDPSNKSLVTVIGIHDNRITDADVNLLQDLQDYKRQLLACDTTCSGGLTYAPMVFNPYLANTFTIPAFDVLFSGEVVRIGGNNSASLTQNIVNLPQPTYWNNGSTGDPATIYIVYLEIWFEELNPDTQTGYYVDANGLLYYYPYGCVNAVAANMIPNDTVDPFQGEETTHRSQIQWALRTQPVAMSYDFSTYQFGLDPGATAAETIWGQAAQDAPVNESPYQFTNMASINGDAGIWRAGNGVYTNELATMDGYTYAMPVGVVIQKNTGPFNVSTNVYGCASSTVTNSGTLQSQVSGRYDNRFADSIWPDDVVDTRQTISLTGWNNEVKMKEGFVDLIMGNTRAALNRGDGVGSPSTALGSVLPYYLSLGPTAVVGTKNLGQFSGYTNGFSSDARTFYSTQVITVDDKSSGIVGGPWLQGDSFSISLGASSGTIASVNVQALVNNLNNSKTPVLLLQGQLTFTGLNTASVVVAFQDSLVGTSYNPGVNNLYVTLGVTQAAGSGVDLGQIPIEVYGGTLQDGISGLTLPVFGVSEYESQASQTALTAYNISAINPEYSNLIFGTRIWLQVPGSQGIIQTTNGNSTTSFALTRTAIDGTLNGWYVTKAWDLVSGNYYTILSRSMTDGQTTLTISGSVSPTSTLVVSMIAENTCQVAYNAPVQGITSIEETVIFGNYFGDVNFSMDSRISLVSPPTSTSATTSTLVFAAANCTIKGIAGDDVNQFIWTQQSSGVFSPTAIISASLNNGVITIVVPSTINLAVPYFFVGSIYPALDPNSQLVLSIGYIPYQGEAIIGRNYDVVFTEDNALLTTNGTGAAPVPGLEDIYPYNRQLPIVTSLPSQAGWNDSDLDNSAIQSIADSNYIAKTFANVEHTFFTPLHTNDFIQPIDKDIRKLLQFSTPTGNRGFAKATPHVGFAVNPPTPKSLLTTTTSSTIAPITIYVNNVTGSNANNGMSLGSPVNTITYAVSLLPPILCHPCSIQLMETGVAYNMQSLSNGLELIALGDGTIRTAEYFALANLAFTIQDSGRLVITQAAGVTNLIQIDASTYVPQAAGPTSAFFIDSTRVLFNGIEFSGFADPAIYAIGSDIEFVNCSFVDNITAGSFDQGCNVTISGGSMDMSSGVGMVLSGSQLLVSGMSFTVDPSSTPGVFFTVERNSSLTLQTHNLTQETNITASTVIAQASINSSIECESDFTTAGSAVLQMISVLERTVNVTPFVGGVTQDSSCLVTTAVD